MFPKKIVRKISKAKIPKPESPSLIFHPDPKHQEAYKTARTNLVISILKSGCKKISIVSSVGREGKTTTSINLAFALAQQINSKVLLVDCDLRKPGIHRFFGKPFNPGLTDYLAKTSALEDVLLPTDDSNLSIICSGTIPSIPSEILSSVLFENFLNKMESFYNYIIIDTSPLNLVIDALSVAKLCDGAVMSAVQGSSSRLEFAKTLNALKLAEIKVFGAVLHGVEIEKRNNHDYGYSYSY